MPRAFKTLSIDLRSYELLERIAQEEDRTMVAILRRALALYVATPRNDQPCIAVTLEGIE